MESKTKNSPKETKQVYAIVTRYRVENLSDFILFLIKNIMIDFSLF